VSLAYCGWLPALCVVLNIAGAQIRFEETSQAAGLRFQL
jgi:hypothetical protein